MRPLDPDIAAFLAIDLRPVGPLVIAVSFLLLGIVLMAIQWWKVPAFFRRRPEVVPAGFLEGEAPPPQPTGTEGS